MCGIAGFHIKRPGLIKDQAGVEAFVNHLLLGIEPRGKDSTGFVAVTFGDNPKKRKAMSDKAAIPASEFIKSRERIPENVQTVLLHTRYATKGSKDNHLNNHPVMHKTCFAVHNGHISNDDDLFAEFSLDRYGQVDSEIIPALAYKIGLDDPPEFLNKFVGPMATAIVDPVNFPGRLVLAKGRQSPLIAYENSNFIVWASLQEAIHEAWGHILGTPPAKEKYQTFKEGEIVVFDDATRSEATFVVPTWRRSTTGGTTGTGTLGGTGYSWQANAQRLAQQRREEDRERERDERRRKRAERRSKKNARGNAESAEVKTEDEKFIDDEEHRIRSVRAIVTSARLAKEDWLVCPAMHLMDNEAKEALFEARPDLNGLLTWVTCPCCRAGIEKHWMHGDTLRWGNICEDCYQATITNYQTKARIATVAETTPQAEETDEFDEDEIEWLDPATLDTLQRFVDVEKVIHNEAINAVADETDLDPNIVEFLIFRVPSVYIENHPIMADIKDEFDSMYQEYVDELWEQGEPEPGDAEARELRGEEPTEYEQTVCGVDDRPERACMSYCSDHGNYHGIDDNCPDCALDAAWAEHGGPNLCGLPRVGGIPITASLATKVEESGGTLVSKVCPTEGCGRFIYAATVPMDKCWICRKKDTAAEVSTPATPPKRLALAPGPQPVGVQPVARIVPTTCCRCTDKAEFYYKNDTQQSRGWCVDCFIGCEHRDDSGKCDKLSNHIRVDGARVCHEHARGQDNVLADTLAEKRFGELVELGRF